MKLKRMYAEMALENHALKDLIEKTSEAAGEARGGAVLARAASAVDPQGLRQRRVSSGGLL